MWPFDKLLTNRIKELEHTVAVLEHTNVIISQELVRTRENEADLLNKIFTITGVNRIVTPVPQKHTTSTEPIKMGGSRKSWPELKDALEVKSKEEYWSKKKDNTEQIDKLEKDLGVKEDAS